MWSVPGAQLPEDFRATYPRRLLKLLSVAMALPGLCLLVSHCSENCIDGSVRLWSGKNPHYRFVPAALSPSRRCVDILGTGGTHSRPRPVQLQCLVLCQIIPGWNRKPCCFALPHRLLRGCAIGCFSPRPARCGRLGVAGCCRKNNRGPRRVPPHKRNSSGLRYLAAGDWFARSTGAHCRLNKARCHLDRRARRPHASRGTTRYAGGVSLSLPVDHKDGTTARILRLFRIKALPE